LGVCFVPNLAYTLAMPKLDIIHNAVKGALIKDGWTITDDPFIIEYKKTKLYADLGAERPIAAQRGGLRIVVEVKSFVGAAGFERGPWPIRHLSLPA
jgi:XisH protein